MESVLTTSLFALSVMGIISQVFIGLVLLRLIREMERWQRLPIMVPEPLPIVVTLPVTGLQGGALQVRLPNGTEAIWDVGDGAGPFAGEAGVRMLATFQRVER